MTAPTPILAVLKAFTTLKGVEVVDEYTVAVHYAAPCFSYINDFCFQNVAGMMSPNVFEAENFQTFTDVVGTGPYIREEMISGDFRTRFVRNENYWGEAPYYDEVVIKQVPEASSRLQALQTGEVDPIYGADLSAMTTTIRLFLWMESRAQSMMEIPSPGILF